MSALLACGAASASAATSSFVAAADSYTSAASPARNYGSVARLRVDGSPRRRAFVLFDVRGLAGHVTRAALILVPASSHPRGFTLHTLRDLTWRERQISYVNAPGFGRRLGASGPIKAGVPVTIDVTSAVSGNGTVGFALTGSSKRALALYSRDPAHPVAKGTHQLGPHPPKLVITSSATPGTAPPVAPNGAPAPGLAPSGTPPGPGGGGPGTAPPNPGPAGDPVIAAAGDIACDPSNSQFNAGAGSATSCRQMATSDLMVGAGLAAVLPLGDTQYECGGLSAFQQSYDLSWGRVKPISHPAVGNHEYLTSGGTGCNAGNAGAAGYFDYFGAAAGTPAQSYYSYDVGSWHLIALNTQCSSAGGCGAANPQGRWLHDDLAAHQNQCTLAYWHIPLFSSGGRANANSKPFWDALYAAGADLVLSAHDHVYERFAPQTPDGSPDPGRGLREFVVGTGGANHTTVGGPIANSEVLNPATFGVLELTLRPDGYDWRFVPAAGEGSFTDAGSGACH